MIRFRTFALTLAACAVALPGSIPLSAAAEGVTPPPPTKVTRLSPLDADNNLAAGYTIQHQYGDANCESGSPTVGKAYQCFTPQSPQGIFDSCWVESDQHYVTCLVKPWMHKVQRLHVTRGYGDSSGFLKVHRAWGLRVGTALRCLVILGPTDTTRGHRVDYRCNHKTVLAGRIHQGTTWHAHAYREIHHGGHRITYKSRGTQPISTAWFGKPSQKD